MSVFVLNQRKKALMPTTSQKAKSLLKQGKAKVIKRTPFTIQLLVQTGETKQPLTLGVDTGSSTIGSAVVDSNNNVLYLSQIEIRNDITKKMEQRSIYRQNRRNRKTRYRKPRFLNRSNSIREDRFSPTMRSKIESHLKEIKFAYSILPITRLILETGTFDPHALKNPDVLTNKWLYQKGINYGYANTKAYVLVRDNYTCQHCKGKSGDRRLEVHHIIYQEYGGSDEETNLKTLCETCHKKVHKGILIIEGGHKKGQLKHATQMNSIRKQLLKRLPEAEETFGFITKEHRQLLKLDKTHCIDAVVIASEGSKFQYKVKNILYKKCIADGDYQQTKGIRSEQKIPTGKINGFRKFDKVKYLGKEYFIKGRMSTGYVILMDIEGKKIDFSQKERGKKTVKMKDLKRIGSRKTWITTSLPMSV